MNEYTDSIGNVLREKDNVFVLIPKTHSSYRKAIVRGFRNGKEILVEYVDNYMYHNEKNHETPVHMTGPVRGVTYESKYITEWIPIVNIIKEQN